MNGIWDMHTHVLPGVDDGSKTVAQSIEMLQRMAEQGIQHVIATPHFYPQQDSPERFLRRRREAQMRLYEEMQKYRGLPTVSMGAEVYFFHGISDSEAVDELTIGPKKCILIEAPHGPWDASIYRELEALYVRRGMLPIVAHLDRYIRPLRTQGIPKRLAQMPVMVQVNAEFFLERATSGMAMRMLREGRIHLLGSDCHNLASRKPNLGAAIERIEKKLGQEALEHIMACQQDVL